VDSSVDHTSSIGAVFFDLDKTIIAKSSALAFGRPFYRGGLISARDVLRSTYAQMMFRVAGADHERMERMRRYVSQLCTGWSVQQVTAIVGETLHTLIDPFVYTEALELIAAHRAAGREVVIVSSSGAEVAEPIGRLVGADRVIATRMAVADGRYTGQIDFYAYGPGKAAAIRELAAASGYRLADCFAYSDSITDLPMLEAVGHPHAVNPDRALRRVSEARGWPVLEFRSPTRPAGLRPVPVLAAAAAGCAVGLAWYASRRRRTIGAV
jgi:HAD superfamily hydrolase (TIGR01490 family)